MNTSTTVTGQQHTYASCVPAGRWLAAEQDTNPGPAPLIDLVDEWGRQSFPASDPPANW